MSFSKGGSALRRACTAAVQFRKSKSFSTSTQRDASWGFIGLGAMGKQDNDSRMAMKLTSHRLPHGEEPASEDTERRYSDGLRR